MIISVVNTKGGTGKTTSAVFIAHGLAQDGKTLLVDADPQGSAMSWSKLVGEAFAPSTVPLAVQDLPARLPALSESFKHVVIDTPPGEGNDRENPIVKGAVLASDTVLLPLAPSSMEVDRLGPTLDLLSAIEVRHRHSFRLHILLTKVRAGTKSSEVYRAILEEDFKLPVLASEIPLRERYGLAMGQPVIDLGEYNDVIAALAERVS